MNDYKTLRENVVAEIRKKILSRELQPGMRIKENDLAAELSISRGPIREALRQLEQEGMVEYVRNAGCSVRMITPKDVYELYLLKCNYEILALKLVHGKFSEEDIECLEDILEKMRSNEKADLVSVSELDHELHRVFIRKSGIKHLEKAWEDLRYSSILAGLSSGRDDEDLRERQYRIHKGLVEACKGNDLDVICEAIQNHYMIPVRLLMEENDIESEDILFEFL